MQGVGIKDYDSHAAIDHTTFHENWYGVACFEKNFLYGGGSAEVKNSIFSNSLISPYFVDYLSTITLSYCLSYPAPIPGPTNITGNPMFVDAATMNFHLLESSPCIDSGKPDDEPDLDGSRTDIGAFSILTTGGNTEHISNMGLLIYPNPSNGLINIKTTGPMIKPLEIEIIDITGSVVCRKSGYIEQIDLSGYHKGIYLLKIKMDEKVYSNKVIIQ
jgi:hypothetical protein